MPCWASCLKHRGGRSATSQGTGRNNYTTSDVFNLKVAVSSESLLGHLAAAVRGVAGVHFYHARHCQWDKFGCISVKPTDMIDCIGISMKQDFALLARFDRLGCHVCFFLKERRANFSVCHSWWHQQQLRLAMSSKPEPPFGI